MRGARRQGSGHRSVRARAEGKGGRGARPEQAEAAVGGGRASQPRARFSSAGVRSVRPLRSEPGPCDPKGALLDVIVAAATIFFRRFCVSSSLQGSAVTGRCGPEGRLRSREAKGLTLQVAECVCVP